MTDPELLPILGLARRLAAECVELARPHIGQRPSGYKHDNSVVTATDHLLQEHIIRAIAERFPDHAILGEEKSDSAGTHPAPTEARFCWVIDPIDGTRNFVAGFPCFATAIAVLDRAEPVVAAIAEHNLGTLYWSARGSGAWSSPTGSPAAEPQRLEVYRPADGEDILVGTPSTKEPLTVEVLTRWLTVKGLVFRNTGSTAMHLALVAAGGMSAAFSKRCKIWDLASGMLLITESGGLVTSPFNQPLLPFDLSADHPRRDIPFLAGGPEVHRRLLATIAHLEPA